MERLNNVKYLSAVCRFAESVMIRIEKHEVPAAKFTERWVEGIWLGRSLVGDRHLAATPSGVIASRSVRRFPEGERWNRDLLLACKGTPWQKEGYDEKTFVLNKPASLPWLPHTYRKAHQEIRAFLGSKRSDGIVQGVRTGASWKTAQRRLQEGPEGVERCWRS